MKQSKNMFTAVCDNISPCVVVSLSWKGDSVSKLIYIVDLVVRDSVVMSC